MTFRQVIPNSSINPSNERYECYLVWWFGGIRSWLFSHTDGYRETNHKSIQLESDIDIRSIPTEENQTIRITTKGLDSEEFEYVKSLMSSNRIYKVLKDGTKIPVAIKGGKIREDNKAKEYGLTFSIVFREEDVLNV